MPVFEGRWVRTLPDAPPPVAPLTGPPEARDTTSAQGPRPRRTAAEKAIAKATGKRVDLSTTTEEKE